VPGSTLLSGAGANAHQLALALPFEKLDLVPQELSDAMLWHSVYGWDSTPPPPGPGASIEEHTRALVALDAFHEHRHVGDALTLLGGGDGDG
jgi:hypothetical protein